MDALFYGVNSDLKLIDSSVAVNAQVDAWIGYMLNSVQAANPRFAVQITNVKFVGAASAKCVQVVEGCKDCVISVDGAVSNDCMA